ncbi:MAG: hypothetical protein GKR96_10795 [Gammaproteobacteria bacterium]|nr:hypothetical protein [Gammaproteobacteria bacterium]
MNVFLPASSHDSSFLVSLISESSGGVWCAIWKELADNGESIEKSGARYLADTANSLSIANATIAELNDSRVGAMICYQEGVVKEGENQQ